MNFLINKAKETELYKIGLISTAVILGYLLIDKATQKKEKKIKK